jgi:pantothenate kinase
LPQRAIGLYERRLRDHRQLLGDLRVEVISTDGFMRPNAELEARGLLMRKGFPESYDSARLLQFLSQVKAGHPVVKAPVYSHLVYDVVPGEEIAELRVHVGMTVEEGV